MLEALDDDGHITDIGRRIVGLPLDPALARSLLAAADLACVPDMLTIAAMLSAESIFTGGRCERINQLVFRPRLRPCEGPVKSTIAMQSFLKSTIAMQSFLKEVSTVYPGLTRAQCG